MNKHHPIWTDFKHISVHFNRVIIFPVGGGGHFLMSTLSNPNVESVNKFNEFSAGDGNYFLDIDQHVIDNDPTDSFLDEWYLKLKSSPLNASYDFAYGHVLPYLFCKIYKVTIGEMVYLDWDQYTSTLCCLLNCIKNKLNTDFNLKSYQIYELLLVLARKGSPTNTLSRIGANSINRLDLLTKDIRGQLLSNNNLVSWQFLLHSASNDIISDVEQFKIYMENTFGPNGKETDGAKKFYEKNKTRLSHFITYFNCVVVQYRDVFINRQIPVDSLINSIDFEKVKIYHDNNLDLVIELSKLFTAKGAAEVQQLLPYLGYSNAK